MKATDKQIEKVVDRVLDESMANMHKRIKKDWWKFGLCTWFAFIVGFILGGM